MSVPVVSSFLCHISNASFVTTKYLTVRFIFWAGAHASLFSDAWYLSCYLKFTCSNQHPHHTTICLVTGENDMRRIKTDGVSRELAAFFTHRTCVFSRFSWPPAPPPQKNQKTKQNKTPSAPEKTNTHKQPQPVKTRSLVRSCSLVRFLWPECHL